MLKKSILLVSGLSIIAYSSLTFFSHTSIADEDGGTRATETILDNSGTEIGEARAKAVVNPFAFYQGSYKVVPPSNSGINSCRKEIGMKCKDLKNIRLTMKGGQVCITETTASGKTPERCLKDQHFEQGYSVRFTGTEKNAQWTYSNHPDSAAPNVDEKYTISKEGKEYYLKWYYTSADVKSEGGIAGATNKKQVEQVFRLQLEDQIAGK